MAVTIDDSDDEFRRSWRDRVRHPTWRGWFSVALVLTIVSLGTWWAVDAATLGDRVARNVTVGGVDVGRKGPGALEAALDHASEVYGNAQVELIANDETLHLTGRELGMTLDERATITDAKGVGRDDAAFARPFLWFASFFQARRSPVHVRVDRNRLTLALAKLPGQTPVKEPTLVGTPSTLGISRSHGGFGYDPDEVARQIEAEAADGRLPIRIRLTLRRTKPRHSDEEALALVKEATDLLRGPIEVHALDKVATIDLPTLRSWLTSRPGPDGLELAIDDGQARATARLLLGEQIAPPTDAAFTVLNDEVQVVPAANGQICCAAGTGETILKALRDRQPVAYVPLTPVKPKFTTEQANALGITTRLGTNADFDGIRNDRMFTVAFDPASGQGPNVLRSATALRGRVLLKGQTLSMNAILGAPSPDNGYVPAQTPTPDGMALVPGAGTDLTATALFNAAFFAGLDIPTSAAHGVAVPHLPPGREANLGWPGPDLVIRNNTPTAILIWTRTTPNTVTVMIFGAPGSSGVVSRQVVTAAGPDGVCQRIVTTRSRTVGGAAAPDDSFTALYGPIPEEPGRRVAC